MSSDELSRRLYSSARQEEEHILDDIFDDNEEDFLDYFDCITCTICHEDIPLQLYTEHSYIHRAAVDRSFFLSLMRRGEYYPTLEADQYAWNSLIGEYFGTVQAGLRKDDLDRVLRDLAASLNSSTRCPICMQGPPDMLSPVETLCGHAFCKDCIATWLTAKKKCPLCMADLEDMLLQMASTSSPSSSLLSSSSSPPMRLPVLSAGTSPPPPSSSSMNATYASLHESPMLAEP